MDLTSSQKIVCTMGEIVLPRKYSTRWIPYPYRNLLSAPSPSSLLPLLVLLLRWPSSIMANRSEPIPIYMDEMLRAGRAVYDKQSPPVQELGQYTLYHLDGC